MTELANALTPPAQGQQQRAPIRSEDTVSEGTAKLFELGLVTVKIFTIKGEQYLEDWASDDADKARDYASETACCSDVAKVEFQYGRERRVYRRKEAI